MLAGYLFKYFIKRNDHYYKYVRQMAKLNFNLNNLIIKYVVFN